MISIHISNNKNIVSVQKHFQKMPEDLDSTEKNHYEKTYGKWLYTTDFGHPRVSDNGNYQLLSILISTNGKSCLCSKSSSKPLQAFNFFKNAFLI